MIRPDIEAIRLRHLKESDLQRTLYEGHLLVDLASLCDEVERLRARTKYFENEAEAREIEVKNRVEVGDIVDWMRATADMYAANADLVGEGYAITWRIIADLIEKKSWEDIW